MNNNVIAEKLEIAMVKQKVKKSDVAKRLNCTSSNIYHKIRNNNLTENDLREISNALGCDVEINLIIRETKEVI